MCGWVAWGGGAVAVDLQQLRLCIRMAVSVWSEGTPSSSLQPHHNTQESAAERWRYRVLAARAPTCSWIPNVAEDQKSELSLFCQVCHDKMLQRPPPHFPFPPPIAPDLFASHMQKQVKPVSTRTCWFDPWSSLHKYKSHSLIMSVALSDLESANVMFVVW